MHTSKRINGETVDQRDDALFRNMVEQARDAILVVDTSGNILMANQAATTVYGYSVLELRSLRIHDLRSPETRGRIDSQLKIAQEEGILFRTVHLRRTGEPFTVEVSSRRIILSDKEAVISVIRDITATVAAEESIRESEEKYRLLHKELTATYEELTATHEELTATHEELVASEEELRQQFEELLEKGTKLQQQNIVLTSLHETALGLMRRLDINSVLRVILSSAVSLLGVEDGFINVVDDKGEMFVRKTATGRFAKDMARRTKVTEGLLGQAYVTGTIAVEESYSSWAHRFTDPVFDDLHCFVVVPLKTGEKVEGALGLAFTNPGRTLAEHEITMLQNFADIASIAFDNATLMDSYKTELKYRRSAEKALKASEEKYRTIFEAANDGIYIHEIPTGKIIDVNQKACKMGGYSRKEIISSGMKLFGTGEPPYSSREIRQWVERAATVGPQLFEWQKRRKDGSVVWWEVNMRGARIGNEDRVLGIVRDISERKAQEQVIWHMAYHDSLTGLPNRAYLTEFLNNEMEKAARGETAGAVLFVDLDDLKMINDNFGHSYGDDVIKKAGAAISAEAGHNSFVARIGGDEFIVVLPGEAELATVEEVAANIVRALCRDYEVGESKPFMSASAGIVVYPSNGGNTDDILSNADIALYAAKAKGKNTWCFYEAELQKTVYENMLIKQGLRNAIERNELSLHFQPMVHAHSQDIVSFEALLRWTSAELGQVSPARFIPLAEENNTIQALGKWVIQEACQFIFRMKEIGKGDIGVSVNVSPRQLANPDFVPFVNDAIKAAGINPNQLEIEITEHALIASFAESIQRLRDLRALGVRLALDDFGSGYCSLVYLKNLPVEILKIDKSFIDGIESDETQLRFLSSIVNMAHVQKLSVVAEGVETDAQLKMLRECQCDYIQGFLFGRPMPAEEALLLLAR